MQFTDYVTEWCVGSLLFPLSNYLMNRRGIVSRYKNLLKTERCDPEMLRRIQLQKLQKVVENAALHVPYYRNLFNKIGLIPQDIKSLESMKAIPPLTRQDIIDYHRQLVDERFVDSIKIAEKSGKGPGEPIPFARFKQHRLVKNTSSGSTGAPTIFYEDGAITAANWSNELRLRKWYGLNPGAREARLTRIATEYMPGNRTLMMRKILWNQLLLPGVNLSQRDYELCYQKVLSFNPAVLWGFTSSLVGFAEFIKKMKKNPSLYQPQLCITWAAPLHVHEKRVITEVFGCPVTNIYGAREVGHIAAICPHGSFHINQETLLVETEKDKEEYPSIDGGEILVTTLEKTPMPFLRYRMGDVGEITNSQCSCGRTLQVLKSFQGRTGEIFITKEGRMISPNFWCRTFMNKEIAGTIQRFQIVYHKNRNVTVRLVKSDTFTSEIENKLKKFLYENFCQNTLIQFDYVDVIKPQISGKYQMVINEMNDN